MTDGGHLLYADLSTSDAAKHEAASHRLCCCAIPLPGFYRGLRQRFQRLYFTHPLVMIHVAESCATASIIDILEEFVFSSLPNLSNHQPVLPPASRRRKIGQPRTTGAISTNDIVVEHMGTGILGEVIGEDVDHGIIANVTPHPQDGKLTSAHTQPSPPHAKTLPPPAMPVHRILRMHQFSHQSLSPSSGQNQSQNATSSQRCLRPQHLHWLSRSFPSRSSLPLPTPTHRMQWPRRTARRKAERNTMFGSFGANWTRVIRPSSAAATQEFTGAARRRGWPRLRTARRTTTGACSWTRTLGLMRRLRTVVIAFGLKERLEAASSSSSPSPSAARISHMPLANSNSVSTSLPLLPLARPPSSSSGGSQSHPPSHPRRHSDCLTAHQGEELDQEQELDDDLDLALELDIDDQYGVIARILVRLRGCPRRLYRQFAETTAAVDPFALTKMRSNKAHEAARQAAASVSREKVVGHMWRFVEDFGSAATLSLLPMARHACKSMHEPANAFYLKGEGNGAARFTRLGKTTLSGVRADERNVALILVKPLSPPHGSGGARKGKGKAGRKIHLPDGKTAAPKIDGSNVAPDVVMHVMGRRKSDRRHRRRWIRRPASGRDIGIGARELAVDNIRRVGYSPRIQCVAPPKELLQTSCETRGSGSAAGVSSHSDAFPFVVLSKAPGV
ncbi:hypothetical protein EDB92DRAFT_2102977 [Lactarius akahatsu]|uniref:Uncharacterized protein n=1 Tax=Lactarius akahatsu TaxID=416441 RepID=A0AAD4QEJ1_9AGAM|nr:hypothetical protein EDB92DRAFT_2102977 [Lactarius akahatsu]